MCVFLTPSSKCTTENYTLLSRVRNKPYDVFGCWLNETHLISGNLHWIGNMTSCSVLWLNKAFQVSVFITSKGSEKTRLIMGFYRMWNQRMSTSSSDFSRSRTSTPALSVQWWWPTAAVTTTQICCWTTRLSLRLRSKKGGCSITSPSCLTWGPLAVMMKMKWRMKNIRGRQSVLDSRMAVTLSPPSRAWITSCRSVRCEAHISDPFLKRFFILPILFVSLLES